MNRILTTLAAGLVLAACAQTPAPQPSPDPPPIVPAVGNSPVATAAVNAPAGDAAYPTPARPVATPSPAPTATSDPSKGAVTGRLAMLIGSADVDLSNTPVFLAPIIKDATGREIAAGYERTSSPNAITDEKGNFVFRNIAPGRYGLVIDVISSAYLLRRPTDGKDLIIVVDAGKQTEMGKLVYPDLPITPVPPKP